MKPGRVPVTIPKTSGSKALSYVRENRSHLRFLPIGRLISTSGHSLHTLFAESVTLRVDNFPTESWLYKLSTEVIQGILGGTVQHTSLFLSPKGGTTPPHYDAHDVLVVQLRGSKSVVITTEPHDPDPKEDTLLESLGSSAIQKFELGRGDAVLIPRGYAHRTSSTRASVTLGVGMHRTNERGSFGQSV